MGLPIKNILYWNLFITILPFFAAINTSILDLTLGFVVVWLSFIVALVGSLFVSKKESVKHLLDRKHDTDCNVRFLLLITSISFVLSLYAANFYTGNNFADVINAILVGDSNYNNYQIYFKDNDIGVFSISKLPAIFSMFCVKLILFYCFYCLLLSKKELQAKTLFLLAFSVVPSIYFSLARGTSFEIFNLLVLSWFTFIVRYMKFDLKFILFSRTIIFGGVFVLICILSYNYNISARYSFEFTTDCTSSNVCYDRNSFISLISPSLGYFTSQMASYFTFGLLYTNNFIAEMYFFSYKDLFYLFTPYGYVSEYDATYLCRDGFDCGANWIPDVIKILYNNGLILFFIVVFLIGLLLSRFLNKRNAKDLCFTDFVSAFYCFYFFISLHVGNFITSASDNQLMIFLVISIGILKFFMRKVMF